jgi:hypothetical protein
MDNTVTLPGYKYYVDAGGERPDVCVAFLDIEEHDADAWVNGICLPVSEQALQALDARERNYERLEVTRSIEPLVGRTWAYVGRDDSRRRFAAALLSARCVVARSYLETVESGFRDRGESDAFAASTSGARPPVRDLRRIDI